MNYDIRNLGIDDLAAITGMTVGSVVPARSNDTAQINILINENECLLAENKRLLLRIKELFENIEMLTDANLQIKADIAKREGVR